MSFFKSKKFIAIAVILVITTVTLAVIPHPPIRPRTIPIDDYSYAINFTKYELDRLMRKEKLPCTAVSLIVDNETIYQKVTGMANIETDMQADLSTVFKVGSISKLFTAIEIMKLYEEGLVDLDVSITTYLPDFKIKSRFNSSANITIRNILAHRSGLPRTHNLPQWAWDNNTYIFRDMIVSLEESYMAYPAEQQFKYSNIAFNILARIIEVVTGEWFAFRMRDSLLHPIGMESSGFVSSLIPTPQKIAMGYFKEGRNNVPYNQYDLIGMASGGLHSTLGDLNKFAKFVLNNGEVDGIQIINETTLSMMYESYYSNPSDPQKVGMGFFLDRSYLPNHELAAFHAGTNQGTKSIIAFAPEQQLAVILVSNSAEFEDDSKALALEILEIMHETRTGLKKQKECYDKQEVDIEILKNYTGIYAVEGDVAEIYLVRNKLKMNYMGYNVVLKPINDTTFYADHWLINIGNIKLRFFEDFFILSLEGVHNPICLKYSPDAELMNHWSSYLDDYEVWYRHFSIYNTEEVPFTMILYCEDGVLRFNMTNFVLLPLSQTELIIQSGAFEGETIVRDPNTGFLYWESRIFKPTI
ncbi:MAG: beta-lactamase family protein [Candidatus Heimdallarchaeota archaeon]|nr:beta-lactamase family protein [Candidatus Heimdallarchaeota archaeon]